MDGLALLEEIRVRYSDIFVVIVTGYGAIKDAVSAMKAGAYDYILKPFDFDTIRMLIEKITAQASIIKKDIFSGHDRRKSYRFENFIGQDPKMFQVFQRIIDVAETDATVLVTGETGTGKELVADAIHYRSPRKSGPLVTVIPAPVKPPKGTIGVLNWHEANVSRSSTMTPWPRLIGSDQYKTSIPCLEP